MKRRMVPALLAALAAAVLAAPRGSCQTSEPLSFGLAPGAMLPTGESSGRSKYAAAADLSIAYRLPSLPLVEARAELGYGRVPIVTGGGVDSASIRVGPGLRWPAFKGGSVDLDAAAGFYYGAISGSNGAAGGDLSLKAGGGVTIPILPSVNLGIGAFYRYDRNLFDGPGISIGLSYRPGIAKPVEVKYLRLTPVFPVLYKYYDSHPLGTIALGNASSSPATEIAVTLFVAQYMKNPTRCEAPGVIEPGKTVEIPLSALFADQVLEITEGTKASAKVSVTYTMRGRSRTIERTATLDLYDRNAVVWRDDRIPAAYVTAKDPAILQLSRNVSSWVKGKGSAAIDENIRVAMAIHEALRAAGLAYAPDPKSSFAERSKDRETVDFLQFPRQTLQFKGGDCDDLSILYCALLESLGIGTAFITIPGHIFIGFELKAGPEEAKRIVADQGSLIFRDGAAWVPFEVTLVQRPFLEAWEAGAREWASADRSSVGFARLSSAWETYAPVAFTGGAPDAQPVAREQALPAFLGQAQLLAERELAARKAALSSQPGASASDPKYLNALGVLCARYGMIDEARSRFSSALERGDYLPAIVNMGNLLFSAGDASSALAYYDRALGKSPSDPRVLLQVARARYDLKRFDEARAAFERLKTLNPALASQVAFLGAEAGATRAAAADSEEKVTWYE